MFCTQLTDNAFLPAICFEMQTIADQSEDIETEKEKEKDEKEVKAEEDDEKRDLEKRRQEKLSKKYGITEATMLYTLKTLYIGGCAGITEKSVVSLANRCPKLMTYSIPATDISDLALLHIGKSLLRLQHLNIALCAKVTPFGIRQLVRNVKNLKFLDVSGIETFDNSVLEDITENCLSLKTLDISRTFFYSPEVIMALVKRLKPSLNMLRMRARSEEEKYSDELFKEIEECVPNLGVFKNY